MWNPINVTSQSMSAKPAQPWVPVLELTPRHMPITGLTSIPNPPKTNGFITIGKVGKPAQSYANKASTNTNISQPTTKPAILTNAQLDNLRMTRLTITTNAATNFGLTFTRSMTKANVIQ